MGRIYAVGFKNVAVSAAQDLVALLGSAGKVCEVRRAWLHMNDTTLQPAQGLRLNLKLATATLTLGSGGATPTPSALDNGDSAAGFTAHVNDTTPGTTSGAFRDVGSGGGHNYGNFERAWESGKGPKFGVNQGFVFELLSTVAGTCHFSGGVEVEEIGG